MIIFLQSDCNLTILEYLLSSLHLYHYRRVGVIIKIIDILDHMILKTYIFALNSCK